MNINTLFEEHFPEEKWQAVLAGTPLIRSLYPDFDVQVLVIKDCPPRDPEWEELLDISRNLIDDICELRPLRRFTETLTLIFPERWLSVCEEVAFMNALCHSPSAGQFKRVRLVTSSPVILTDLLSPQVKVLCQDHKQSACLKLGKTRG